MRHHSLTPREDSAQRRSRANARWYVTAGLLLAVIAAGAIWLLGRDGRVSLVTPEVLAAEIVPSEGDDTSYGIPLSLSNTRQFIDHYESAALTHDQQAIVDEALSELPAVCCDDNSMATCCCPCNLAKSVWGLSRWLVVEHGYGLDQVRESVSQWLHFVHGDYYVRQEIEKRGISPGDYGVSHGDACYVGNCELAFVEGGCGGMGRLVQ